MKHKTGLKDDGGFVGFEERDDADQSGLDRRHGDAALPVSGVEGFGCFIGGHPPVGGADPVELGGGRGAGHVGEPGVGVRRGDVGDEQHLVERQGAVGERGGQRRERTQAGRGGGEPVGGSGRDAEVDVGPVAEGPDAVAVPATQLIEPGQRRSHRRCRGVHLGRLGEAGLLPVLAAPGRMSHGTSWTNVCSYTTGKGDFDGIFAPGLADEVEIAGLTSTIDAPLNLLADGSVARLRELGVRRISTGSLPYRVGLAAALSWAVDARTGNSAPVDLPYDQVNGLAALAGQFDDAPVLWP